jgi:hypothetical protein
MKEKNISLTILFIMKHDETHFVDSPICGGFL